MVIGENASEVTQITEMLTSQQPQLAPSQILRSFCCLEALQIFQKDLSKSCLCNPNIRLIITKITMPIINGFEFTKKIKELMSSNPRSTDCKIVGLYSYNE